ncbi:enoyl-CoA hydratase/isomerase family protein [Halobacteriales archaeon QS_3_64_16]|nr:MAG: enoyl-CoA hydratase/isomerase family protein [Halobacteriales archaeon QS_3_64_16]
MNNDLARIERVGHRVDVFIDRPEKRNAMNEAVMADLTEAFETVGTLDGVRAATLLGEGPVFCAGMDLGMMRERVGDPEDFDRETFPRLLDAIENCPVPTVAGIERAAPAGAFELTLPCDFRILGSDASYGVIEVALGTFPHGGATQRLPRLVGLAKAKELVLTGEFIDPEEAKRCGLVTEVVDPGTVAARTRGFADDLAENAPLGMERAKRALNGAFDTPLETGLQFERALGRELDDTQDYREGFDARIEGRDPEFEGH